MKNFYYIATEAISKNFLDNYFINDLIGKYSVHYLFLNTKKLPNIEKNKKFNMINCSEFSNSEYLFKFLKTNAKKSEPVILFFLPTDVVSKSIYAYCSHLNLRISYIDWGGAIKSRISSNNRILLFLFNHEFLFFIRNIIHKIFFRKIVSVDTVFFSGLKPRSTAHLLKPRYTININFFDINRFEKCNVPLDFKNKKYAVFLDVNMIEHPDYRLLGYEKINSEQYYKNLNSFFDYLEKKHKLKIIVCPHPTTTLSEAVNFLGRTVISNNSAGMVKQSSFVISHHSTSVTYAVLAFKPIIFIYDNQIKATYKNIYRHILGKSYMLKQSIVNISLRSNYNSYALTLCKRTYKKYIKNYHSRQSVSSDSDSKIFCSHFNI